MEWYVFNLVHLDPSQYNNYSVESSRNLFLRSNLLKASFETKLILPLEADLLVDDAHYRNLACMS